MEKAMSDYAAAAKQIRQWLKGQGIAARVKSEGYSMGSSVRIYIQDQKPEVVAKVEEFAKQYQYGHFDGMQDLYEYSNSRKDLPQAKFVFVNNEISDEVRQQVWDLAINCVDGFEGAPANASEAGSFYNKQMREYGSTIIYRLFSGAYDQYWNHVARLEALEVAA